MGVEHLSSPKTPPDVRAADGALAAREMASSAAKESGRIGFAVVARRKGAASAPGGHFLSWIQVYGYSSCRICRDWCADLL
jgi:hypothetical protein